MELPPLEFVYKTFRLDPASPHLGFLAGKYAALDLRALTTDPESFGIAYSTAASYNPTDFQNRLLRPEMNVFICVAHPADLPPALQQIEHGAWVGMVTQLGPTPKDTFWLRDAGTSEPLEDELETKWHQTGTWIDPAHRGKGIAKQMVESAVAYAAESLTAEVKQVRVRAFIGPRNETSKSLYGRLGFSDVGRCTMIEAMVGNGYNTVPFHGKTDWSEEMLHSRVGIVMERVVKKD